MTTVRESLLAFAERVEIRTPAVARLCRNAVNLLPNIPYEIRKQLAEEIDGWYGLTGEGQSILTILQKPVDE